MNIPSLQALRALVVQAFPQARVGAERVTKGLALTPFATTTGQFKICPSGSLPRAGEQVFDPVFYTGNEVVLAEARMPAWYREGSK